MKYAIVIAASAAAVAAIFAGAGSAQPSGNAPCPPNCDPCPIIRPCASDTVPLLGAPCRLPPPRRDPCPK